MHKHIFLYGPPGSGKSSLGRILAANLSLEFLDLDELIVDRSGMDIPGIFDRYGESGFRDQEMAALRTALEMPGGVVALGGGTLLEQNTRDLVSRAGRVLCLTASLETLISRLNGDERVRPLIEGDRRARLAGLLESRFEHYSTFGRRLNTDARSSEELADEAQVMLGAYRVSGMGPGYPVRVGEGIWDDLGQFLDAWNPQSPVMAVTDENVGRLYAGQLKSVVQGLGADFKVVQIPAGEAHKTLQTVAHLWDAFAQAEVDRRSIVIALGGGVVGDLSGFVAAAYMRGITWLYLPTSLLAMVDASLGGKTGIDLSHGKNLVGAFHPPAGVLADISTLATLPEVEFRNGMAEVVKHGVISDGRLFDDCARGRGDDTWDLQNLVSRAMRVKIKIIQCDPYEQGFRESLNFGHTVGHAIETVSNYGISHGEAVSIGMVAEARISEGIGLAEDGLVERLEAVLDRIGLPTAIPRTLNRSEILDAMVHDKKRVAKTQRFSLPVSIGEVRIGVDVAPGNIAKWISKEE
jgi:shikimate kinase/3-dehydroquinate synthase